MVCITLKTFEILFARLGAQFKSNILTEIVQFVISYCFFFKTGSVLPNLMYPNVALETDAQKRRRYINQYFRRCLEIDGVQNVIVFDSDGIPRQSTYEKSETIRAIGLFDELITKVSRAIQTINHLDSFASMRLRTKKFEIIISKDLDDLYFVVFQNMRGKVHIEILIKINNLCYFSRYCCRFA